MTTFMLPTEHPAETTLRELAEDWGIVGSDDLSALRTAILSRRCEREAWIRQLENERVVMKTLQIPTLRGQLLETEISRDAWSTRARAAESSLRTMTACAFIGLAILGGLAIAVVATIT